MLDTTYGVLGKKIQMLSLLASVVSYILHFNIPPLPFLVYEDSLE